ncbi:hypothetical protein, partial [uncultured Anaerotruncus sp.]|uniref:hypothetical protein n=1 Tax=uncultured Anaerotruncus sp. TaxID=905011 RepID=UPI00321FDC73
SERSADFSTQNRPKKHIRVTFSVHAPVRENGKNARGKRLLALPVFVFSENSDGSGLTTT